MAEHTRGTVGRKRVPNEIKTLKENLTLRMEKEIRTTLMNLAALSPTERHPFESYGKLRDLADKHKAEIVNYTAQRIEEAVKVLIEQEKQAGVLHSPYLTEVDWTPENNTTDDLVFLSLLGRSVAIHQSGAQLGLASPYPYNAPYTTTLFQGGPDGGQCVTITGNGRIEVKKEPRAQTIVEAMLECQDKEEPLVINEHTYREGIPFGLSRACWVSLYQAWISWQASDPKKSTQEGGPSSPSMWIVKHQDIGRVAEVPTSPILHHAYTAIMQAGANARSRGGWKESRRGVEYIRRSTSRKETSRFYISYPELPFVTPDQLWSVVEQMNAATVDILFLCLARISHHDPAWQGAEVVLSVQELARDRTLEAKPQAYWIKRIQQGLEQLRALKFGWKYEHNGNTIEIEDDQIVTFTKITTTTPERQDTSWKVRFGNWIGRVQEKTRPTLMALELLQLECNGGEQEYAKRIGQRLLLEPPRSTIEVKKLVTDAGLYSEAEAKEPKFMGRFTDRFYGAIDLLREKNLFEISALPDFPQRYKGWPEYILKHRLRVTINQALTKNRRWVE